ncbi:MAG: acyl-CoA dehydrogenase family protein [Deltaproteobacteria bacterium]
MASFFHDNDDLRFHFDHGIDWASLVEATEHGFRDPEGPKDAEEAVRSYREIAELVGELVADRIAPLIARVDREDNQLVDGEVVPGAALREIFEALNEVELHKLCLPRELGGLNSPLMLYLIAGEMLARADVSVMGHFSFHGAIAMAMLVYSMREGTTEIDQATGRIRHTRFEKARAEIARGEAWGCMDITEPDAGSDMAALRTVAEQDADGRWFVTGQKIFISSGHGKYHFVIARTEGKDSGLEGLSMFMVQAYEDLPGGKRVRHVIVERIEEKLGHHGSVTAALSFERAPAELIGKRGEGFEYMLVLMNNARVAVGFESLGLAEAALRMAEGYAAERRSMGKPIGRHEMIADWLDEMRTDVQAIRALAVASAYHEEMSQKLSWLGRFVAEPSAAEREKIERELPRHRATARRLTPLLKYFASEKAVQIARRCLQIHGGMGYIRETGAEKLLRDSLVLPIYEGTSQIQALMAMKDTLSGILKRPQAFVTRIGQTRWRAQTARDGLERRVARLQAASLSVQQLLVTRTATDKLRTLPELPLSDWPRAITQGWDPKRDFALAMLHAERLIQILADEAIAELLLAQAKSHPERRELLERFLDRAELRSRALTDEITNSGARILRALAGDERAAKAS